MVRVMRSHRDIIAAFGGYGFLAEAIGVNPKTAIHWGVRGIPAKYWPDVETTQLGKRLGITAQLLRRLPRSVCVTEAA
jgi:hypothetical protein